MTGNKFFRALPYIVISLAIAVVAGVGYGIYEIYQWVAG
jgi:hypothetical protein